MSQKIFNITIKQQIYIKINKLKYWHGIKQNKNRTQIYNKINCLFFPNLLTDDLKRQLETLQMDDELKKSINNTMCFNVVQQLINNLINLSTKHKQLVTDIISILNYFAYNNSHDIYFDIKPFTSIIYHQSAITQKSMLSFFSNVAEKEYHVEFLLRYLQCVSQQDYYVLLLTEISFLVLTQIRYFLSNTSEITNDQLEQLKTLISTYLFNMFDYEINANDYANYLQLIDSEFNKDETVNTDIHMLQNMSKHTHQCAGQIINRILLYLVQESFLVAYDFDIMVIHTLLDENNSSFLNYVKFSLLQDKFLINFVKNVISNILGKIDYQIQQLFVIELFNQLIDMHIDILDDLYNIHDQNDCDTVEHLLCSIIETFNEQNDLLSNNFNLYLLFNKYYNKHNSYFQSETKQLFSQLENKINAQYLN